MSGQWLRQNAAWRCMRRLQRSTGKILRQRRSVYGFPSLARLPTSGNGSGQRPTLRALSVIRRNIRHRHREWLRHGNQMAGAKHYCNTFHRAPRHQRRILIPDQQAVEIVRTIRAGLCNQRQVQRQCSVIVGTCLIVITVRAGDQTSRTRRTHEHLAIFIRSIHHLILQRNCFDLGFVIAKIGKAAECKILNPVTAGTYFAIDLKARCMAPLSK